MSQKDPNKINNTNVNQDNKIQEIIFNQDSTSSNKNNNTSTKVDNNNQTNNTNSPENKDVDFEHDSEELGTESTVSTATQNSKEEKKWEVLSPEELSKRFNEANKIKEEGNKLYNESKFHEAIEKFTQAIALVERINDPRSAVYYANRSACYLQLGNFKSVVRDCTSALELDSKYLKAWLRRACAHEKLNYLTEALEDYKHVLQLDPHNKEALDAVKRLPEQIKQKQEKEKEEMIRQLKELGNKVLGTFGLSLDNFVCEKDPQTGGYKINFKK